MSTTDKRYPASQALDLAQRLLGALEPFCEKIVIAGSLRRKRPFVGDVELLFIPKIGQRQKDMFTSESYSLADEQIEKFLAAGKLAKRPKVNGTFTWGPDIKLAIHVKSGIPVDLFATTAENWWSSLVMRTGSKENNMLLTTGAQKLHRSWNVYGCGVTNDDGSITPATSEQHVFELCGVKYREPEQR